MTKLKRKDLLFLGLTLFSMFFGAGNLIFPPFLGEQAGNQAIIAGLGFIVSAVGLPVLGVIAVAKADGLNTLASRVHPRFADLFTLLIYLSIGPCLAIPRTASTSYEMVIAPFFTQQFKFVPILYSFAFFALALYLALNPEKLSDRLGKVLCPLLLTLITIIFLGSFFVEIHYAMPSGNYAQHQFVQGFLDGYQTMDTIAALNFGIIIALNIKNKGLKDAKTVVKYTIKAGMIAGICLAIVYGALIHIGALSSFVTGHHSNGAQTLTAFMQYLFQNMGIVILGAVFFIACLNTCVGLICCCSEYFVERFAYLSYKQWAFVFAVVSMLISNIGLDMILHISLSILNLLYPLSIVLIFLAFIHRYIQKYSYVYQITMLLTGIGSLLGIVPNPIIHSIPLSQYSLGWIPFAVIGLILGIVLSKKNIDN